MYLKAENNHRIVLGIVLVFTLILGLLVFKSPPSLYPDPSWGFQVMRSMQMGGGFNMAITPDPNNIAQNTSQFLSWWSPGQYLLPYLFKTTLGVNVGQSAALTILLCCLSGIFGFYNFFRKVGFSAMQSALSIAFIACQQFYVTPYIFYNGGETLLFGFLGWFLYGCFSFKRLNRKTLLFILLAGWIGFFCKSAFLWMYASGLCCLWISVSIHKTGLVNWIKNGVLIAAPAVLSLAAIYQLYISKGPNPAASAKGLHFSLAALGFPLGSPLLSGFSVDDLSRGLLYHPDGALFTPVVTTIVLLAVAIGSIVLVALIIRYIPYRPYQIALSVFYILSTLFFTYLFLKQAEISYEGRHFRIVGILAIPGTIYLFSRTKIPFKIIFGLIWLSIAVPGMRFLKNCYTFNSSVSAHGPSGISQLAIDKPSLNYLQTLDHQYTDAIFAFTSPDLGLDMMHNRIITLDPVDEDFTPEDNIHLGHAGPLFVLLPAYYMTNGNADKLLKCFPDYTVFTVKKLSKDYVLYRGL